MNGVISHINYTVFSGVFYHLGFLIFHAISFFQILLSKVSAHIFGIDIQAPKTFLYIEVRITSASNRPGLSHLLFPY
jgi:hypothetical protein